MSGYKIKKGCVNTPNFADNTIQSNCITQRYDYIPIDFIKCKVIGLSLDHFKQNMNLIEYESKKENKSKHLYYSKDNIKIKYFVDSGLITLQGSLHKYFNDGLHNHNLFTYENYLNALKRLKNEFGVSPENLYLYQIEFGVNIKPPIKTNIILENILNFKGKSIENKIRDNRGSYYNQFEFKANYIVKIYNKAKQYDLKTEIMRFEIKLLHKQVSEYRKLGIKTLADFNQFDKKIFIDRLIKTWDKIVFYDPTIKGLDKWHKYSHPNFWSKVSNKQISKHRTRLNNLIQNHSNNIKGQISNLIIENIKEVQNSDFSKKRTCKLTGVDISQQQKESFLLSHTGLKHLRQTNYQAYNRLKDIFLSQRWETSSTQTQIKEIAHNIRSKYNYLQRHKPANQLRLF